MIARRRELGHTGRPRLSLRDRLRAYLWGDYVDAPPVCACCRGLEPPLRQRALVPGDAVHVDGPGWHRVGILVGWTKAAGGPAVVIFPNVSDTSSEVVWTVGRDLPRATLHAPSECAAVHGVAAATAPPSPELAATIERLRGNRQQ